MQENAHTLPFFEALRRGTGEILTDSPDGTILYEKKSDSYYVSAPDTQAAEALARQIPDVRAIFALEKHTADVFNRIHHFNVYLEFIQVVYPFREPLPLSDAFEIRPLGADYAPRLAGIYPHIPDADYFADRIRDRLCFGIFQDGTWMGFIGVHDDGTMGFLEVFPEYRRRGAAVELMKYLINEHIRRGWTGYGHVTLNNKASLALQKKMGATFDDRLVYWCF